MNHDIVKMAFTPYMLGKQMTLEESIEFLWKNNLINVGELTEYAIMRNGGQVKVARNTKGRDFEDGSDGKYVTVGHYNIRNRKQSYATVGGIFNKTGLLRIVAHEPKTNKNYFFKIPYKAYRHLTESNTNRNLKIPFKLDGSPNPGKLARENYWDYQCTLKEWAR